MGSNAMAVGLIFDIQHYAVHDGPGIRTLIFFKGCPLACAWCSNPESQACTPELRHDPARCAHCLSCAKICSAVIGDAPGLLRIDRARCGHCESWPCLEACPRGALLKVGQRISVDDVMSRITADKAFYDNSGGGVTFSGGEPFAQPEFLADLLARCRTSGIRAAVETCGYAAMPDIARLEPLIDLFLYDLKIIDPQRHRQWTGRDNAPILENLRFLAGRCAEKIVLRVPLIPGGTDGEANLAAIAEFSRALGLSRVELLAYHALGAGKYEGLGRIYRMPTEDSWHGADQPTQALRIFKAAGLTGTTDATPAAGS